MSATRAAAAAAAIMWLTVGTPAQTPVRDNAAPQTGTGAVSGVVMSDEDQSRPIRHAIVSLSGGGIQPARMVVSDDAGRFAFGSLPAGSFTIAAARPPFVPMTFGQTRPGRAGGVPVAVAAGQQVIGLTLKLPKGAAITGTVTDESGQPRRGVQMQIFEVRVVNGERVLEPLTGFSVAVLEGASTDDRGVYRFYGLPPGEYVVSASIPTNELLSPGADLHRVTPAELAWAATQLRTSGTASLANGEAMTTGAPAGGATQTAPPAAGQAVGLAPTYYPGTTDPATAATITLARGEERAGIDVRAELVPVGKIQGRVIGVDGQPPPVSAQVQISAAPTTAAPGRLSAPIARPAPDGSFSIPNLPPGVYTVTAISRLPMAMAMAPPGTQFPPNASVGAWARTDVTVAGQDLTGLTLTLQPGMTITGRVVFESSTIAPPADLSGALVILGMLRPNGMPQEWAPGVVKNDGAFQLGGIMPGRYVMNAAPQRGGPAPNWMLKSSTLNGRDVLDAPFEMTASAEGAVVTFTDRAGEISGVIEDASGRPASDYSIVLFSTNKTHWWQGSRRTRGPIRPATDGKFRIGTLPAGEYYLAALTDVDARDLSDAAFLEELALAAIKVTLGDGEKKVQNVKLAR